MIIIDDIEQGTPEWKLLKAGVISASNLHKIISAVNGEYSKQADKYVIKLISERLTGEVDDDYTNAYMERGREMEAEARDWYRMTHSEAVRQVGFVFRDESRLVGCSPDGLMEDRGFETKCVIGSTMVSYLLGDEQSIVNEYKQQVQGGMWITGFDYWELLIYHPSFDPLLITVKRDDYYCRKIEMAVARTLKDMNDKIKRLGK